MYIHAPWTASENIQRAANCVVGVNYPFRIVNHVLSKKFNAKRLKHTYRKHPVK